MTAVRRHHFYAQTASMRKAHRKFAQRGQSSVGKRTHIRSIADFSTASVNSGIRLWWGKDPDTSSQTLSAVVVAASSLPRASAGSLVALNSNVSRAYMRRVEQTTGLSRKVKKRERRQLNSDFAGYLAALNRALPRASSQSSI